MTDSQVFRPKVTQDGDPAASYSATTGSVFGAGELTKPIPDKAEVAIEYPDKFYIGIFEQSARFDLAQIVRRPKPADCNGRDERCRLLLRQEMGKTRGYRVS